FEPVRISIQGEVIRDLDSSNTNNSHQSRKTGLGDSDDEEQQAPLNVSERSTMDIYRQRQQKRVKLTKTNSTDQLQSLQRIATVNEKTNRKLGHNIDCSDPRCEGCK
ncbi:unnamed protein product, partial [Rotaria sp. Silwood2]